MSDYAKFVPPPRDREPCQLYSGRLFVDGVHQAKIAAFLATRAKWSGILMADCEAALSYVSKLSRLRRAYQYYIRVIDLTLARSPIYTTKILHERNMTLSF